MPATEIKLTESEAIVLRSALACLRVQSRTGALGIMHAGRFVAMQNDERLIMNKAQRQELDDALKKCGLKTGLQSWDK